MNWTLEVVVMLVSDVDRAKTFCAYQLGLDVGHDTKVREGERIVQLTPPGSGCSVETPTAQPDPLDNVGFVFLDDPDGNASAVQQISARA